MKDVIEGKVENEQVSSLLEEVDDILDADFELPIEPRERLPLNQKKSNLAYRYYLKVQPDLREWWEEFNTSLDDKGHKKYRTIWQFAKEKTKNKQEQDYIWEMIGPRPQLKEGRQLRVPWLGDWQLRRQNGWWGTEHPGKIKTLARAFKTRLTQWDAVRSSAPYLVQMISRNMRLQEKIDEAFGGEPFDLSKKVDDPENLSRARLYLEFHDKVRQHGMELLDKWMEVHGVDPKNPVQFVQNNTLAQQINNPLGLLDNQGELTPMMKEIETFRVAKQLTVHSKNFNMPLPEVLSPKPEPTPEPKPNGRTKVQ